MAGAGDVQNVVIYYGSLEYCVIKFASIKTRPVKVGRSKPATSEVAVLENALPEITSIKYRETEIDTVESHFRCDETLEKVILKWRVDCRVRIELLINAKLPI